MKTLLIVLTLAELAILVVVLAAYLIAIAATLRNISHTLGMVTFGVRAIEKQTEPIPGDELPVAVALVPARRLGDELIDDVVAQALGNPPLGDAGERADEHPRTSWTSPDPEPPAPAAAASPPRPPC